MNTLWIDSQKGLRRFCKWGGKPRSLGVSDVRLREEHIDAIIHERLTKFALGPNLKLTTKNRFGFSRADEEAKEYFLTKLFTNTTITSLSWNVQVLSKEFLHLTYRTALFASLIQLCLHYSGSRRFAAHETVLIGRTIGICRNLKRFCWYRGGSSRVQVVLLLSRLFFDLMEETSLIEFSLFSEISCRIVAAFFHKNEKRMNYVFLRWVEDSNFPSRLLLRSWEGSNWLIVSL